MTALPVTTGWESTDPAPAPVLDGQGPCPAALRARREQLGLARTTVAHEVGVSPSMVQHWESGRHLPSPVHQRALAHALGIPGELVAACFDAVRPPPPPPPLSVQAVGLRGVRRQDHTPVRAIAAHLGVPEATVYNWESGRARLPLHHLQSLAAMWRCDTQALRTALVTPPPAHAPRPVRVRPLRHLRRLAGLSRSEVGARLGVTANAVARWENGARPPLHRIRALARLYRRSVTVVAAAAGHPPPPLLDRRQWEPHRLPEILQTLRTWTGWTQQELAGRCGCSVDAVRAWEHGRVTPRPHRRRELEDAFGLAPGALLPAWPARPA